MKLGRCVVGTKVQVEMEDGYTAMHACGVAAAVIPLEHIA